MKMAFNIDYDHTRSTGIGRYGIELVTAWNKIGHESELWMGRNTKKNLMLVSGLNLKIRYFPFPRRVTNYFWPSLKACINNTRWVHSSNGMLLPPGPGFKQVAMVHDLVAYNYGDMKAKEDTEPWRIRLKMIAKNADCIVVNSLSTRSDLLNVFPGVENKVFLTPLGIDHFSLHKQQSPKKKHILSVGTVEPRKNIDGLLKGYALLFNQRKDIPPLVIAGMDGFRAEEFKNLPVKLGIAEKVRFTGFVTDSELSQLYAEAYCLVHTAHHEGFGFTVAEAFTWELPVVASNTGGLGEYFSEAAWMVNPADLESIASGIVQALDSGISPQQVLARQSLVRELTWKNCAEKTLNAITTLSD